MRVFVTLPWHFVLVVSGLVLFALAYLPTDAHSQTVVPVENGKFFQVKEGVFRINERQTIDLTDKHLLFTFRRTGRECRRNTSCIVCVLNGRATACDVGKRFDLKWPHAPFHLKRTFADRRECVLDVVNFTKPKGASATAVFRVRCI